MSRPRHRLLGVAGAREGALLVAGLAWALLVDVPNMLEVDGDPYTVWGDLGVGLLMQWTGLIVWRRPGTGRTGPMLYLAGLLWFIGSGVPEPLGWLTFPWRGWYEPLLVAVILAYPIGRLARRADQAIVAVLVIAYVGRSLARMFFFDGAAFFGRDDFVNPTLIVWDEALWKTVEDVVVVIGGLVAIAVVVTCVGRWLRASGPARRTLTPVLASGLAIAPMLGWTALTTPINAFDLPMPDPIVMVWFQIILRGIVPLAIVIGIVRLQSARSSLADLLLELDRGVPVGRLEEVLRRQLRDPSVRLVFPRADHGFVDARGLPVALPAPDQRLAVAGIDDAHGTSIAFIVHDPALAEDPEFVRAAGAAARLSLENERLQAEVRAQLNEVRELSTRLVEASDSERRRVERDLHDGAQQRLVTLALRLKLAREHAAVPDGALTGMLADASAELDGALRDLRELARGIHPAILTRSGLSAAVTALAERSTVPVSVRISNGRCPPSSEVTAYFVIAEALTNLSRHAAATSAVVDAECRDGQLLVKVADDGVGGASMGAGTGLSGLRDRVLAVGGSIEVESPAGSGTTIRAVLPCA